MMSKTLETKLRAQHVAQAEAIRKLPSYPGVKREFEIEYAIAAELAKARKSAGMTQEDVAEVMGTTQSVVSRIERGSNVSVETLERYVSACGRRLKVSVV
mgnify:CR=1 FL=1